MNNPEFVRINEKKYKINTDFRVAIECNDIAKNESINEYEKSLAIIYKLFGEEGLDDTRDYAKLLELGQKYLLCGKEPIDDDLEPDMDYTQDMDYIEASFMSDYKINLKNEKMHWWTFSNLINGLSNSELGNCCVLNRIRNLRNYDVKEIKDRKELEKIIKAKKQVALKNQEVMLSEEQKASIERFNMMTSRKE